MTALELESIARLVLRARGKAHRDDNHGDRVCYYFEDACICAQRIVWTIEGAVKDELEIDLVKDGDIAGVYAMQALKITNGRVVNYDDANADEAAKYLMRIATLDILAGQQFD